MEICFHAIVLRALLTRPTGKEQDTIQKGILCLRRNRYNIININKKSEPSSMKPCDEQ